MEQVVNLLLRGHSKASTSYMNWICQLKLPADTPAQTHMKVHMTLTSLALFHIQYNFYVGANLIYSFPNMATSDPADTNSAENMFTTKTTFLPANQEDGCFIFQQSFGG